MTVREIFINTERIFVATNLMTKWIKNVFFFFYFRQCRNVRRKMALVLFTEGFDDESVLELSCVEWDGREDLYFFPFAESKIWLHLLQLNNNEICILLHVPFFSYNSIYFSMLLRHFHLINENLTLLATSFA